jgi:large subunit ribosomal protein L21
MYAIVEIAGKQYKIEKDKTISVDALGKETNESFDVENVLLVSSGDDVQVGQPYLTNVKVKALVLGEVKGDKVRGIKFKRRKNYQRTIGHRALYSRIKITDLALN